MFLRRIEHTLALLLWRDTEDAKHQRNRPVPVPLVGDPKGKPGRDALQVDELLARRRAKRQAELNGIEGR